jgi:hypothetical protein
VPECEEIADENGKIVAPWNAPSELALTERGRYAKELFLLLYTNHGWWSKRWGKNSMGSWWAFLALFLSYESSPLWQDPFGSGWGSGTGPDGWGDPKPLFTQAAVQWFWNWGGPDTRDAAQNTYLTTLQNASLPGTVVTAVFNRIGSLGSFLMRQKQVVSPTDSNYIHKTIPERLAQAFPRHGWNAQEMFAVVSNIASPRPDSPRPDWKTGGLAAWGNYGIDSPNLVYIYGNFRIYIP